MSDQPAESPSEPVSERGYTTDGPRRRPTWQPWLVLAAVFGLGVLCGGAGMRARMLSGLSDQLSGANGRSKLRLRAMKRHLSLSDAQSAQIEEILTDARAAHDKAREPCRDQVEAAHSEVRAKIDKVLTVEQRAKHDERRKERRRKHDGKRGKRRHRRDR